METLLRATTIPVPRHGDSISAHDHHAIISLTSGVSSFLQDVSITPAWDESVRSVDSSREAAADHRRDFTPSDSRFARDYGLTTRQSMASTDREAPPISSSPHVDYSLQAGAIRVQPEEDSCCTPSDKEDIAISPEKVGPSKNHCRQY